MTSPQASTPTHEDPTLEDPTTSKSTTQEQDLEADLPGFRQPPPTTTTSPDPVENVTSTTTSPLLEDELGDDRGGVPPSGGPSMTGSSLDLTGPLAQLGSVGLQLVGLGLHNRLAPDDPDAWLVDQDDVDGIVGPLARIANRHASDVAGEVSPDMADALEAGFAVCGYAMKNAKPFRAQRARAAQPAGEQVIVGVDENGQPIYGPAPVPQS